MVCSDDVYLYLPTLYLVEYEQLEVLYSWLARSDDILIDLDIFDAYAHVAMSGIVIVRAMHFYEWLYLSLHQNYLSGNVLNSSGMF